jgi:ankyrin repeat protein
MIVAFVFGALALQTCDGGGIFRAIDSRDVQLLSTYTNNSEIVNSRNAKGLTPLMEAARIGDVESVRMLLASGADEKSKASGFMVKDQVASYLRRTGAEKERVIDFFRRQGLDDMVRMVENEARSLGETPERVIAWKEILDILNRRELTKEKLCEAASQTNKVTTYAQLAISNNIDVVDACKMYIRMADAGYFSRSA